ncbi:MAG: Na(+)/H(+) antiporter subunit D [Geminicoccaceae bacterium]|nr:Na(+)/H(+) antiporter subunit D [Geminicoccaceae bacterium]
MTELNPALILIIGALPLALLPVSLRKAWMLFLPLACLYQVSFGDSGSFGHMNLMGMELETYRLDSLSRIFAIIFSIAAGLSVIYSLHQDDPVQETAGLIYSGSAIGAALAGDLLTLFIFWELTAISSVFLIWARGTDRAYKAGMRYMLIQVGSGVLLLAGTLVHYAQTGSLAFNALGIESLGGKIILVAFGIKCAFPLLHNWLQDAYPEATITGTVWLSAFTTKLAVYALARGYAGTEMLIWVGVVMTAFPIFYAVIENDLRRVLAYSLNNQLGFMVTGIGVGTELALNGTVAHAFCHILYKGLLFMSMGAVMFRTGTCKGSELGGLYKSMPWTTGFCIVGAASISAFPLFSGFVSKSMILAALAENGYFVPWLVLLFASAGVFHHSGIKIPFFAFFAHDSGRRVEEAPRNMLIAMGVASFLCIGIGVLPGPLYAMLPYPVDFSPYTFEHVVTQLQLLLFSALAFTWLMRGGVYPPELRSVVLDTDVLYRKGLPAFAHWFCRVFGPMDAAVRRWLVRGFSRFAGQVSRYSGPEGALARSVGSGSMTFWIIVVLAVYLAITFAGNGIGGGGH